MDTDHLAAVPLLAALADPTRLRVVRLLRDGPMTVGAVAAALGLEVVNVSHHLGQLRRAGALTGTKKGRFVEYAVNPDAYDRGGFRADGLRVELPAE
jgi:ArsR family transcriptional regulator